MNKQPPPSGAEKRRSQRRQVVDSFSIFATLPKRGGYRVKVHDLSDRGLGFDFDADGETPELAPVKKGERFELHLYLNQSLYLSLDVLVARIDDMKAIRQVGAEVADRDSPDFKAYVAFLALLDSLSELPAKP